MESRKQAENQGEHIKETNIIPQIHHNAQLYSAGNVHKYLFNMKGKQVLTGKAAKATISQTSIFLHILQLFHVQTQLQRTSMRQTENPGHSFYNSSVFVGTYKGD